MAHFYISVFPQNQMASIFQFLTYDLLLFKGQPNAFKIGGNKNGSCSMLSVSTVLTLGQKQLASFCTNLLA